jgi:uncharacterized FlaG/YvyC family protein
MPDQPQPQEPATDTEETTSTTEPTEFATVLLTHAKGRAHDEATAKLAECVEAVQRLGKAASVTVQLSIHPVENNREVVRIQDKVSASIPAEKRSSMWFPDDDGALHRNDPNQRELPYS